MPRPRARPVPTISHLFAFIMSTQGWCTDPTEPRCFKDVRNGRFEYWRKGRRPCQRDRTWSDMAPGKGVVVHCRPFPGSRGCVAPPTRTPAATPDASALCRRRSYRRCSLAGTVVRLTTGWGARHDGRLRCCETHAGAGSLLPSAFAAAAAVRRAAATADAPRRRIPGSAPCLSDAAPPLPDPAARLAAEQSSKQPTLIRRCCFGGTSAAAHPGTCPWDRFPSLTLSRIDRPPGRPGLGDRRRCLHRCSRYCLRECRSWLPPN